MPTALWTRWIEFELPSNVNRVGNSFSFSIRINVNVTRFLQGVILKKMHTFKTEILVYGLKYSLIHPNDYCATG